VTQYPVVAEVAEDLNWKLQYNNEAGDWDVYWTDFSIDPDVLIKMHLFQKINHYPGIHVIARKNLLGISLMSLRNLFPEEYNFFPLTWMLPLQYAEFRAYF
jgi:tubulin polyglutamylase TTLL6/13